MARLAVLDADVLIGHLDERDAQHDRAVALLRWLAEEEHHLAASTLTLAEVLVGPALAGRLAEATAAIRDLGVGEVGLGQGAAGRLAALRAETGRKLPDSCVLLAAEDAGTTTIATFDERLAGVARRRGLVVATPPDEAAPEGGEPSSQQP